MKLRDVTDKLLDKNCLTDTSTTKEADFAALGNWRDKVDDLDAGFKNFCLVTLLFERWRVTVNRGSFCFWRRLPIDRLTDYIKHAALRFDTDRHHNRTASRLNLVTTLQSISTL